jgi:hypothetical protein
MTAFLHVQSPLPHPHPDPCCAADLDSKLLAASVERLEVSSNRTSIATVDAEVAMMQAFCGSDNTSSLIDIGFESVMQFSNGARAPPWRSVQGDLCYIVATTHDVGRKVITASTRGYFVNKGYVHAADGSVRLDYAQDGDTLPSLSACLRAISPVFAERIDKQVIVKESGADENAILPPIDGGSASGRSSRTSVEIEDEPRKESRPLPPRKNSRASTAPVGGLPSLRWQALDTVGLNGTLSKTAPSAPMSPRGSQPSSRRKSNVSIRSKRVRPSVLGSK